MSIRYDCRLISRKEKDSSAIDHTYEGNTRFGGKEFEFNESDPFGMKLQLEHEERMLDDESIEVMETKLKYSKNA